MAWATPRVNYELYVPPNAATPPTLINNLVGALAPKPGSGTDYGVTIRLTGRKEGPPVNDGGSTIGIPGRRGAGHDGPGRRAGREERPGRGWWRSTPGWPTAARPGR